MLPSLLPNHFYFMGHALDPHIELWDGVAVQRSIPLAWTGSGRHGDEGLWMADLAGLLPADGTIAAAREWQFRVNLGEGRLLHPEFAPAYTTTLRSVWMQDGQLFDYHPAPMVSPPCVVKIEQFQGSLGPRPLYIYLPRGYDEHGERRYPVLYMHDGQNCFDAFVDDSYAGAWQADLAASLLIRQGLMQECIIVGVSNGQERRILEYLPPYASHLPPPRRPRVAVDLGAAQPPAPRRPLRPVPGRAHSTLAYYRDEVAPFIARRYRALSDRAHTATCGSSLGGLFSIYIAWEHMDFARHHAALSPSFWATRNAAGRLEAIERMRRTPRLDVRLWLDSGTLSSPDGGNDGQRETAEARRALLEAGYVEGSDFQFHLAEGATHTEAAWAARLPMVFQFLFPMNGSDTRRQAGG